MDVFFHKNFEKQFRKLPKGIQKKFVERLALLQSEPASVLLHIHTLQGDKYPYESMNVTADYRALFLRNREGLTFHEIGTHSELY